MHSPAQIPNRLIDEKSPYLLQHAHNPVDWWPWCEQAFAKAGAEDVPVFVSVGYSACHWCHVMERESFEDDSVAALLRQSFVSIKVDREERPDIDSFLMRACQVMTGSGGWPLSIFLTPDGRPFYAGTYFPKRSAHGRIGFTELLMAIGESWAHDRERLLESCDQIIGAVKRTQQTAAGEMTPELIKRGFSDFDDSFDAQYGGFGRAPKFPVPHALMFLMRYHAQTGSERARFMARRTLDCMARGGIHDQIGGGFCRYSTDRMWLMPHFEKMLYDNALLALAYVEAHLITEEAGYRDVATRTLEYLLREMRHPKGGFYTAQDADSQGEEGAYYLFVPDEVCGALGADSGARVCAALGIRQGGNHEGKSIPNRLHADAYGLEALRPDLDALRQYRRERMRLRTDDKVLTAWNALAIVALARASAAFERADYLDAALGALGFIDGKLTDHEGQLLVRWRDGQAKGRGNLDDYAFMCWALIALYDATLDGQFMRRAQSLCERMVARFKDADGLGYWLSENGGELSVRPKESADGAMPCGNSTCGVVLARLAAYTGDTHLRELAHEQAAYLAGAAMRDPSGHSFGLLCGMSLVYPGAELVCATDDLGQAAEFRRFLGGRFLPHVTAVLAGRDASDAPEWARGCTMRNGRTTYYVCRDCACSAPVHTLPEVSNLLIM